MEGPWWFLLLSLAIGGSGAVWKILDWYKDRKKDVSDEQHQKRKDAIDGFERLTSALEAKAEANERKLLQEMDRKVALAKEECENQINKLKAEHEDEKRDQDAKMDEQDRTINLLRRQIVKLEKTVLKLGGDVNGG